MTTETLDATAASRSLMGAPLRPVPPEVEAYRERYRAQYPSVWLSGWRHFATITAFGVSITALSAAMVRSPVWWEWAAIPAGFLIANFVEWLAHRYPMHHPMKGMLIMYEKHAIQHHRFFTHEAMEAGSTGDFDKVLFSVGSLAFFLLGAGLPVGAFFFVFASRNAGWIFTALVIDYYVLYEYCHLAYHLPETSWVGRLPGMARLRRHHTHHHDPRLMADWNFNVTFPILDRLSGTHWERASR